MLKPMKIEFSVDVPSSIALNSAWHFIAALSDVASAERDFYAQNSYAERGTDNLAKMFGRAAPDDVRRCPSHTGNSCTRNPHQLVGEAG